jgi:hypothetical protein
LRPIAKTYIKYPHDREHLPLQIPDSAGNTFATVFWRLGKLIAFRDPTHLYFASLQWMAPTETDSAIEWLLSAGDWQDSRLLKPYRLRVDWHHWSDTQRNTLKHEVEFARNEAKKSNGAIKAWLFFVGTQDKSNPSLLIVNRYQLICCIEGSKFI